MKRKMVENIEEKVSKTDENLSTTSEKIQEKMVYHSEEKEKVSNNGKRDENDANDKEYKNDKTDKNKDTSSSKPSEKKDEEIDKRFLVDAKKVSMSSIRKQLEFYFSEGNLRRDRFLRERLEAAKDDMVDIDILLTFNRIKDYLGLPKNVPKTSLTTAENRSILADAVKASDVVKVNEDRFRMGRKRRVDMKYERHDFDPKRTIVVEGFPLDCKFEEVRKAIISVYDESKIDYIKLRRVPENENPRSHSQEKLQERSKMEFRGDVFVELKTPNDSNMFQKNVRDIRCRGLRIRSAKPLVKWLQCTRIKRRQTEKTVNKRKRSESDSKPEYEYLGLLTGIEGLVEREDIKAAINADKSVWVAYNRGDSEAIIRFLTDESVDKGVCTFLENMNSFTEKLIEKKKKINKKNRTSVTTDANHEKDTKDTNEEAEPLNEPSPNPDVANTTSASTTDSNANIETKDEETIAKDVHKKKNGNGVPVRDENVSVDVSIKRLHGKELQKYSEILRESFNSNSRGRKRGKNRGFSRAKGKGKTNPTSAKKQRT
mmetsp:Transcript_8945/g.11656  ORF Transcript_8945/g.11656 Transcript_8945/m.11656 type:complete len:543 (-) Transcript_8945:113-1741(-)